jgi:hypothetical protein
MFLSPTPGLEQFDPDPALLAFVKCHVTSPVKWEVLRVLASQNDEWIGAAQLVRTTHRQPTEIAQALSDLATDGLVEVLLSATPEDVSYRLPSDEPTSVVLHRLIEAATRSQELRAIIAAHMQNIRQQAQRLKATTAAA